MRQRARRHGNAGIPGNVGILESVTYRIQRVLVGSNPTLSAKHRSFVFNNLSGGVGSCGATNTKLSPQNRDLDTLKLAHLGHVGSLDFDSHP